MIRLASLKVLCPAITADAGKRRIPLIIIAVVNTLYKDLAAMPCADKTVI